MNPSLLRTDEIYVSPLGYRCMWDPSTRTRAVWATETFHFRYLGELGRLFGGFAVTPGNLRHVTRATPDRPGVSAIRGNPTPTPPTPRLQWDHRPPSVGSPSTP